MAKPFIGIKRLWYTNELDHDLTSVEDVLELINGREAQGTQGQSGYKAAIPAATEIKNVHDGTWGYNHDDPDTTDYINELTGKPYYRDKTSDGARTINFTMGVYEFADKANMQGGSVIEQGTGADKKVVGWKSDGNLKNVEKCIIAMTKTGNYIVFADASIIAKGDQQEKNIGLGVTAVCMESEIEGVEAEYMFEGLEEA